MVFTAEQFLFDRSKKQNIASFIIEPNILENNENIDGSSSSFSKDKYNLSELEETKLLSCMDVIRNVIGDTISESKLKKKIISSNFNTDIALDAILKETSSRNGWYIIGIFIYIYIFFFTHTYTNKQTKVNII